MRDWNKNPGNLATTEERMETQPKDRRPEWFLTFLIMAAIYAVYSCFWWGNTDGELAIEKAKNRTYQSMDDYLIFKENNK